MTIHRTISILFLTAVFGASAAPVPAAVPDAVHLLALRVEFPYEDPDDPTTGGRGIFDLRTAAEALDDSEDNENPYRYPYDTPPHDAAFLENHLTALANYLTAASRGKTSLTWEIYPPQGEPAFVAPRDLVWYGSGATDRERLRRWVTFLSESLELAETAVGGFERFNSFLVFNASISEQGALSAELPPLALTPAEIAETGVEIPPTVRSAWFMPQQIQKPGGVIGLNGTFASTFFASFGLPVLLNTRTGGSSVGGWTVMDIGSDNTIRWRTAEGDTVTVLGYIPCLPMGWEQQRLGWLTPVEARNDTTIRIAGLHISNTSLPHAVKVPMTPDEYLLIELRRSMRDSGDFTEWNHPEITRTNGVWTAVEDNRYDAYTPGSGVLVYHVDEARIRQWEPENLINAHRDRPGIYLVEADGRRDVGIVNLFGHPRSAHGIGTPADAFSVTGDTLFATGMREPGNPVSMTNDGHHTGIQVVTAPYGVTGDSVEIRVSWESGENLPERLARYIGAPVIEGITTGRLFSGSDEPYIVFATEDGNIWVLDEMLQPVFSDSGVVARAPLPPAFKPQIVGTDTIHAYGGFGRFEVIHSSGQWESNTLYGAGWSPPDIRAELTPGDPVPVAVTWEDSGTITATRNGQNMWTYDAGDSLSRQPSVGVWGETDADGYGYLFAATPRRISVVSRTGLEVARFDLGRADSTDSFTATPLTFVTGAAVATTRSIRIVGRGAAGDAAQTLDRVTLPGVIRGVPALVKSETGPPRVVAGTEEGWLYAYTGLIPHSVTSGQPIWGQLYGDSRNSNTIASSGFPSLQPPHDDAGALHNAFCYPSPVGKTEARIRFHLLHEAAIRARIYNGVGELVWETSIAQSELRPNAEHEIVWPGGTQFASGLYLIRLEATASNGIRDGVTIPVGIVR